MKISNQSKVKSINQEATTSH